MAAILPGVGRLWVRGAGVAVNAEYDPHPPAHDRGKRWRVAGAQWPVVIPLGAEALSVLLAACVRRALRSGMAFSTVKLPSLCYAVEQRLACRIRRVSTSCVTSSTATDQLDNRWVLTAHADDHAAGGKVNAAGLSRASDGRRLA